MSAGVFLQCSPQAACPAAQFTLTNASQYRCAAGYSDVRCGQCDTNYFRSGQQCAKCPNTPFSPSLLVLIVIVFLAVILVFINLLRKIDDGFIGVVVTFVQILAVFQSFELNWPQSVLGLFSVFSIFNFNIEIVSHECYTQDSKSSYEFKYYMTMLAPLALAGIVVAAYALSSISNFLGIKYTWLRQVKDYVRNIIGHAEIGQNGLLESGSPEQAELPIMNAHDGSDATFASTLVTVFLMTMQLLYLNLAQKSVEIFNCQYNNGEYYFEVEPARKCYPEEWWLALLPWSVYGIIVYIIGISVTFLTLYFARAWIQKQAVAEHTFWHRFVLRLTYKKLHTFKPEYEYWDIIIMVRKLLIVLSGLFFTAYKTFKAVLLIFILPGSMVLQTKKPYMVESLNRLEFVTLLSSISVMLAGLLAYNGEFNLRQTKALGVVIILIIVACMVMLLFKLAMHLRHLYLQRVGKLTANGKDKCKKVLVDDAPVMQSVRASASLLYDSEIPIAGDTTYTVQLPQFTTADAPLLIGQIVSQQVDVETLAMSTGTTAIENTDLKSGNTKSFSTSQSIAPQASPVHQGVDFVASSDDQAAPFDVGTQAVTVGVGSGTQKVTVQLNEAQKDQCAVVGSTPVSD